MNISRQLCRTSIAIVLSLSFTSIRASDISSHDVVQTATAALAECMDWQFVGTCYWLRCDLSGCWETTTPKVSHYQPEIVLSVYPDVRVHPWTEVKSLYQGIKKEALDALRLYGLPNTAASGGAPPLNFHKRSMLRFFETDLIGFPVPFGTLLSTTLVDVPVFCQGQTNPFVAYYQSELDANLWRQPMLETIADVSILADTAYVGPSPSDFWGFLRPRCGFILQTDPLKAAMVIAARAVDVLLGRIDGHIRIALDHGQAGERSFENEYRFKSKDQLFQFIHPIKENHCASLGSGGTPTLPLDHNNTFMWLIWNRSECCKVGGSIYLGDIDF